MVIKNIYKKIFKNTSGKIIGYNLCENKLENEIQYGIQVTAKWNKFYDEDIIESISSDKETVYNIINHLYENCIDVTHFKDVVNDYILQEENIF